MPLNSRTWTCKKKVYNSVLKRKSSNQFGIQNIFLKSANRIQQWTKRITSWSSGIFPNNSVHRKVIPGGQHIWKESQMHVQTRWYEAVTMRHQFSLARWENESGKPSCWGDVRALVNFWLEICLNEIFFGSNMPTFVMNKNTYIFWLRNPTLRNLSLRNKSSKA